MRFRNRTEAGRLLAERLQPLDLHDPIVLGLPRGGVPVAAAVAAAISAPLDVFVARKIGAPGHEELGIGAVAEGVSAPVYTDVARQLGLGPDDLERLAAAARRELERRVRQYRGDRALPELAGREVVVVDDGLATGVTAESALGALRQHRPRRLVLAVPVTARDTAARLAHLADDVVWVAAPHDFFAVGAWYDDFTQTSDDEVLEFLAEGAQHPAERS
ncbi:MAG: phosphoribosyltransferase [Acidimicrobiales bacterium]